MPMYAVRKSETLKEKNRAKPFRNMKMVVQKTPQIDK